VSDRRYAPASRIWCTNAPRDSAGKVAGRPDDGDRPGGDLPPGRRQVPDQRRGGLELTVHGDWLNREFQVKDQAGRVAIVVSRAWFSLHDGYGIQITQGFDVPLALAICIALERVEAQEQGQASPIQNLLGGIGPF
jgi:hypothetical protein